MPASLGFRPLRPTDFDLLLKAACLRAGGLNFRLVDDVTRLWPNNNPPNKFFCKFTYTNIYHPTHLPPRIPSGTFKSWLDLRFFPASQVHISLAVHPNHLFVQPNSTPIPRKQPPYGWPFHSNGCHQHSLALALAISRPALRPFLT